APSGPDEHSARTECRERWSLDPGSARLAKCLEPAVSPVEPCGSLLPLSHSTRATFRFGRAAARFSQFHPKYRKQWKLPQTPSQPTDSQFENRFSLIGKCGHYRKILSQPLPPQPAGLCAPPTFFLTEHACLLARNSETWQIGR